MGGVEVVCVCVCGGGGGGVLIPLHFYQYSAFHFVFISLFRIPCPVLASPASPKQSLIPNSAPFLVKSWIPRMPFHFVLYLTSFCYMTRLRKWREYADSRSGVLLACPPPLPTFPGSTRPYFALGMAVPLKP